MKYYIIKKGIYIHGIYGQYDTRDEALAAFKSAYESDKSTGLYTPFDGHHNYFIVLGLDAKIGDDTNSGEYVIQYEPKK